MNCSFGIVPVFALACVIGCSETESSRRSEAPSPGGAWHEVASGYVIEDGRVTKREIWVGEFPEKGPEIATFETSGAQAVSVSDNIQ